MCVFVPRLHEVEEADIVLLFVCLFSLCNAFSGHPTRARHTAYTFFHNLLGLNWEESSITDFTVFTHFAIKLLNGVMHSDFTF